MSVMTAASLAVTDEQRAALEKMVRSTSLPHRTVTQSKALLWAADGEANEEVARRGGVDSDTVCRWRGRFEGVNGHQEFPAGGQQISPRTDTRAPRGWPSQSGVTSIVVK